MCGSGHVFSPRGAVQARDEAKHHLFFDAGIPAVTDITAGAEITVETLDCVGGVIQTNRDLIPSIDDLISDLGGMNYVTGPIAVEGVRPGDVLRVSILDIDPAPRSRKGFIALTPGFGSFVDGGMGLQDPLPPVTTICSVTRDEVTLPLESGTVRLPCSPFVGTIGVAPTRERRMTLSQSPDYVGDIDIPDVKAGSTLHIRANHPEGLLSLGDVHALQGDGEFGGIAVEIAAQVRVRVDVTPRDDTAMGNLPLLVDEEKLGVIAAFQGTPTTGSVRAAGVELARLLTRLGMKLSDAVQYLSAAARIRLGNMFEPFYSAYVYLDRSTIPVELPPDLLAAAPRPEASR